MMEIIGTSVIEIGTSVKAASTSAKAGGTSAKAGGTSAKAGGTSTKVVARSPNDKTTLWKKGPEKDFYLGGKKYFTITNLYNQKVLTAVEGTNASLDIKGKPKHTNLPVKLFTYRFFQKSL